MKPALAPDSIQIITMYSSYNPKKVRLHVVAGKAFLLGILFTASIIYLFFNRLPFGLRAALYILAITVFYMLEFVTTALFNTENIDDDLFILNDIELHAVHALSIVESWLLHKYWKSSPFFFWMGIGVLLLGQFCRTCAMYLAGSSFHHYVQKERSQNHVLVETGIYSWSRHPSYFGFFWWFVGCQLLLNNAFTLVVGMWKLRLFFEARIAYEEQFLQSFFGDEYEAYRKRTPTLIPGIR